MPAGLGAAALLAFWLTLHYGRDGYMPLDQSIVFDGGWRTLHGQVPFRDYVTPDGTPAFVVQAAFFGAFGVTWLAVCLHAAVFDALAVLLAYALLRLVDVPSAAALAAAALTGVLFYPPFGTGFMDQDAFVFLLAAVVAAAAALRRARPGARRALWAVAPAAVLLAALTKALPGVLGVPLVLGLAATAPRGRLREALVWLAVGTAAALGAFALALAASGADVGLVRLSLLDLPRAVGGTRRSQLLYPRMYLQGWGLATPLLVYPLALASLLSAWRLGGLARASTAVRQLFLGVGLFLTAELYTALTRNDRQNGAGLAFVCVVLVAAPLAARLGRRAPGAVVAAAAAALLGLALADTVSFDTDVNATRLVQNMRFQQPSAAEERALPPALSFLRWDLPPEYRYGPADLARLARDLRRSRGNFVLVGDTTILYALAHRPSTFPAMFFARDEGYPRPGGLGWGRFERLLERTLARRDVRRVVLERGSTWMGASVADFPLLERAVRTDACGRRRYAEFTVVELCRPFSAGRS